MSKYDQFIKDVGPQKFNRGGMLWMGFLILLIVAGVVAYIDQLIEGQVVTNMRDYVLWGVYISNFVFFVATSFVGAIVVAVLRLTKSEWRRPFVRLAEIVALACIIMAGITIVIDMARPDRMLNLFIHARLQSPITWDVIIIPTFIVVSLLLLYFPLIPDFAILRDHYKGNNKRLSKIYGFFAVKWQWTKEQLKLQKQIGTLAGTDDHPLRDLSWNPSMPIYSQRPTGSDGTVPTLPHILFPGRW